VGVPHRIARVVVKALMKLKARVRARSALAAATAASASTGVVAPALAKRGGVAAAATPLGARAALLAPPLPRAPPSSAEADAAAPAPEVRFDPSNLAVVPKKSSLRGADGKSSRGSVASGSSGGSSSLSSHSRSVSRMRRLLDEPPPVLTGLRLLRALGIFVVILSVTLAIGMTVLTDTEFYSFKATVQYAELCARRVLISFNMAMALQVLIMDAKGLRPMSNDTLASTRQYLLNNATVFTQLHRDAYAIIKKTPFAHRYTDAKLTGLVYDTADAAPDGAARVYSLLSAGLELAARVDQAVALSKAELADDENPTIKFLLVNCLTGGNIGNNIKSSMVFGYNIGKATKGVLDFSQTLVFASMGVLMGCAFFPLAPCPRTCPQTRLSPTCPPPPLPPSPMTSSHRLFHLHPHPFDD
jgi:hypothetical protein